MAAPSALQAKLLLLACAWLGACASVQGAGEDLRSQPRPPRFADAYELEFTLSMPYFLLLQPGGLSYNVHVWVDHTKDRVRIDFRDGQVKSFILDKHEWVVSPQYDHLACSKYKSGGGPVRQLLEAGLKPLVGLPGVLPSLDGWQHYGAAQVNNKPADLWQLKEMSGEKVSTYSFYVSPDGTPMKFHSVGRDFFKGSHYDEYNYEFTKFKAGPPADSVFDLPSICSEPELRESQHPLSRQAQALLPGSHAEHKDEAHYHLWSAIHKRTHSSIGDYASRLSNFLRSKAAVLAHNLAHASQEADAPGYSLKLNHFADMDRDEFDRVMLPRKWRRSHGQDVNRAETRPLAVFQSSMTKDHLPKTLDWRVTGADFGVKDQGQCGSCYTFSATGTMEAAWFMATGESRSFSEQMLIDCGFAAGASGCDGGEYQPMLEYVADVGGIASTLDYPYEGQNNFCRVNATAKSGHFTGYVQIPSKDEVAVMEALWKFGPLAVGVDAEPDGFLFYSEGVFHSKQCSTRTGDLDHAVMLVGYGTDASSGQDYWIVKNSWSKFWGDDGYIKIRRGGNDCGIASDAVYAVVDAKYERPGVREHMMALVAQRPPSA